MNKFLAVVYTKEWSMFSSMRFIMSSLKCTSLMHLEFIFLYIVRK